MVDYQGSFTHDLSRPTGMQQKLIDNNKLKEFGWQHQTTLEQGIQKTYDYFLSKVDK
jgi:GDP-L-fucose synthase